MTPTRTPFPGSEGLVQEVATPTGSQAHAFDHWAIDTRAVPQPVLMENAGRCAAQVLASCFPEGPVAVVAGSGNNGGDGWVLARSLKAWGRDVAVLVDDPASGTPQRHGWGLDTVGLLDDPTLRGAAVIVDALLGTGLRGAPRSKETEVIEAVNSHAAPVLALDIPSGLLADTGEVPGSAVNAQVTVTFGAPKLGLLLSPGRRHSGRIVVTEIGFPPAGERLGQGQALTTAWASAQRPRRAAVTHKKAVGTLLIAAGDRGMAGAAMLAARAALRAGVGLVRVASDAGNREVFQTAVPEALFVDRADPSALREAVLDSRALVLGPGYGLTPERARELAICFESPRRALVLDADALTMVANGDLPELPAWGGRHDVVATPHLGELGRLTALPDRIQDHQRLAVAQELAASGNATVLAKGSPSLVAAPDGRFFVDVLGSSDLATAGMGDALAGAIGAYAAQGLHPFVSAGLALHDTAFAHRVAALGPSLTPSDVVESLPRAMRVAPQATRLGLDFVTLDLEPRW